MRRPHACSRRVPTASKRHRGGDATAPEATRPGRKTSRPVDTGLFAVRTIAASQIHPMSIARYASSPEAADIGPVPWPCPLAKHAVSTCIATYLICHNVKASSQVYTARAIGRFRLPVLRPGRARRAGVSRQCCRHCGRERIVCARMAHSLRMAMRATTPSALTSIPAFRGRAWRAACPAAPSSQA